MLRAERVGDVVDREVALAHLDDESPSARLLRLVLWPVRRVDEEGPIGITPEVMAEHAERGGGVPEILRDLGALSMLDEVGAKRLVLSVPCPLGRQEELGRIGYVDGCAHRRKREPQTTIDVKMDEAENSLFCAVYIGIYVAIRAPKPLEHDNH